MMCRNRRGYVGRDAKSLLKTRLLAMGQIDRKRGRDETETESLAPKKRLLTAALQSAFVADKEVVKQHGQW